MSVRINPAFKALNIYFDYPTNAFDVDDVDTGINIEAVQNDIRTDLQGLKVWIRATSWEGSQPNSSELYYDGPFQGQILIDKLSNTTTAPLADNKQYFIKYAFISKIQPTEFTILPVLPGNISTELTGTTLDASIPLQGYLTHDPIEVPTDEDGTNPDFTDSTGQFKVFKYSEEINSLPELVFTIKTVGGTPPVSVATGGVTATIDTSGNYAITGITDLTGTITLLATWTDPLNSLNVITLEKVLNVGKRRPGQTAPLVVITALPGIAFALSEKASGSTVYPTSGIVLTATSSNIPGNPVYTWTYDPGGVNKPVKGTGPGYTNGFLTHTSLNQLEDELTINPAFVSGLTPPVSLPFKVTVQSSVIGTTINTFDILSLYYLKEGSDAVYMGLVNENQTITVDKNNQYLGPQPIIESQALVVEGTEFVPDNLITFSIDSQSGFDNTLVINTAAGSPIAGKPKGYIQATAVEATQAIGVIKAVVAGTTFLRTLTVNRVKDGADGTNIDAQLTNDTHIIPTLADGTGGNYTGASTTMEVYKNGELQTTGFTFYVSELSNIQYTGTGGSVGSTDIGPTNGNLTIVGGKATVNIVNLTADSGYVDITAKQTSDSQLYTERFSLSKNKDADTTVVYQLKSNANAITKASVDSLTDGVHTPSSIIFTLYKLKGNDDPVPIGGDPLYYAQWNSPSQAEPTTYTVVPASGELPAVTLTNTSDVTSVNAKIMYKKQDGTYLRIDKEEIGVVYSGKSGQAVVTSYAFIRTDSTPSTPTGGTYASPNPTGPANAGGTGVTWEDGIPADNGKALWVSIRVFTSDGLSPEEAVWSTPSKVAAPSQSARFEFTDSPTGSGPWSTTPSTNSIYARYLVSTDNGLTFTVVGDYYKIKGENGQAVITSYVFIRTDSTPSQPTGGTYASPNPTGPANAGGAGVTWQDGIPADNGKSLWMSSRVFTSDGLSPAQSTWDTASRVAAPSQSARFLFSPNGTSDWSLTPRTTDEYAKLEVSTDNGITWTEQGNTVKIKGEAGTDGVSIDVQYSTNNSSWGSDPTGAKYIRIGTKTPPATNFIYSTGVKFVPELGSEYTVINGVTSYLHIKYSDDGGTTFTSNNGETVGSYIGTLVNTTQADSTTASDYTWALIKGSDATVTLGTVATGTPGSSVTITNSGTASNAVLNFTIPAGASGTAGRRTATGYLYKTAATTTDTPPPAGPNFTQYTFSSGNFSGGTAGEWSLTAPTVAANNTNRYWAASYTALENASATTTPTDISTGSNLSFGSPQKSITFSGLVTFTSGTQVSDGTNSIAGFNSSTQIDGGQITTGAISAARLQLGQNSTSSRIVLTDQKIEIYESNVLRVKIGNLA
jgi:hypothetical protein